jgi:transaldolase
MNDVTALKVKIFADGADLASFRRLVAKPYIKGVTTNPTLMRKAGIEDYEAFARDLLQIIPDMPVSLEVFADDFDEMEAQALKISSWGENVYVKIPITNTRNQSSCPLIGKLTEQGVAINVTAMMTLDQVALVAKVLNPDVPAIASIFAGRVADTSIDPVPVMSHALEILSPLPKAELLWASPREVLNIFQANSIGCHIITVTNDVLTKLDLVGKDLGAYSLETVEMFRRDAVNAGYTIETD